MEAACSDPGLSNRVAFDDRDLPVKTRIRRSRCNKGASGRICISKPLQLVSKSRGIPEVAGDDRLPGVFERVLYRLAHSNPAASVARGPSQLPDASDRLVERRGDECPLTDPNASQHIGHACSSRRPRFDQQRRRVDYDVSERNVRTPGTKLPHSNWANVSCTPSGVTTLWPASSTPVVADHDHHGMPHQEISQEPLPESPNPKSRTI